MSDLDAPVSRIMREEFASLGVEDHLDLADALMHFGRVRHLPVVEGSRLAGILSQRDILAYALSKGLDFDPQERRAFLHSVDVAEAMSRRPVTVTPKTPLREAARLLLAHRIGALPVVEEDRRVVGLVTESDLLRAAYAPEIDVPAEEVD